MDQLKVEFDYIVHKKQHDFDIVRGLTFQFPKNKNDDDCTMEVFARSFSRTWK